MHLPRLPCSALVIVGMTLGTGVVKAEEFRFHGLGTNTTIEVDFLVKIVIDTSQPPTISGQFDATGFPGGAVICGKGPLDGTMQGDTVTFTVVDQDDDPGCGSGGQVITVTATLSDEGAVLAGAYSLSTGGGGVLDARLADGWFGEGNNLTYTRPWSATAWISERPDGVITGELDATEYSGLPICSRGLLVGTRIAEAIDFAFVSNDPDPGCGFEYGWHNAFTGALEANGTKASGTYVGEGQHGVWAIARERLFENDFENAD